MGKDKKYIIKYLEEIMEHAKTLSTISRHISKKEKEELAYIKEDIKRIKNEIIL